MPRRVPDVLGPALALALATAPAPGWSWGDTAREAGFAAMVLVDVRQTEYGLANGMREMNPLLGSSPSARSVRLAGIAGAGAHLAVSALLPKRWREGWQWYTLGVYGAYVGKNWVMGARITF